MQVSTRHDGSRQRLEGRRENGFGHRRLVAYQVALELVGEVLGMARGLPACARELRVQLVRAALAIPRHVAEAAARTSAADRRARFTVARGECAECDAVLATLGLSGHVESAEVERLQRLADRAGALLTGLILRESRRLAAGTPAAG